MEMRDTPFRPLRRALLCQEAQPGQNQQCTKDHRDLQPMSLAAAFEAGYLHLSEPSVKASRVRPATSELQAKDRSYCQGDAREHLSLTEKPGKKCMTRIVAQPWSQS